MASDLYRDVLKDRDVVGINNPRTRSMGSLSSSDNDYKNYLAGMKPRTKVPTNQHDKIHSSSFVDSAARVQTASNQYRPRDTSANKNKESNIEVDEEAKKEQEKRNRAFYAEFSAVPNKKSIEKNFQAKDVQKKNNLKSQSNIDFSSLNKPQSDSTGSVGRLRSMFDKGGDNESKNVVQLRNVSRAKRDRPYSASFDLSDKTGKPKVSGIYDRHSMHIQPLEVESLISRKKEPIPLPDQVENDKTNSEHPSETKSKIDIDSLLAPEQPKQEETKDGDKHEFVSSKNNEIDMQKKMEIERMKRTQEEVLIEQKFNIKRRSLKDRLNDLASGNETAPTYVSMEDTSYTSTYVSGETEEKATKVSDDKNEKSLEEPLTCLQTEPPKIEQIEQIEINKESKEPVLNLCEEPKIPIESKIHKEDIQNTISIDKNNGSELPMPTSSSHHQNESSPKNLENSMSEIDKYKSAVQRFDDFINSQEAPIIKELKNEDPSVDVATDINQNLLKLKQGDDLSRSSDTDYSQSENEGDGSDLMNSILNHMERSKPENKDYFSLLRSSSREEVGEPRKPDDSPKPLVSPEAPEVLPRLSKLQGRLPTSPPPYVATEELNTRDPSPRESSPIVSSPLPTVSQPSLEYDSRETSCVSSENDDVPETPSFSTEEFVLPPPPQKSNLTKTRNEKKKNKVVFNDGQIEEVVFTYGPKEYNRANADIDPIASSAEWELEKRVDNMDIFSVDLQKDERGLGLSIIGLGVGTETGVEKLGIFVKTLTENGAAQKDGRIQVNDQILEVNGVSLVGVTQFFAAQTLKGTNGVVRFLMGREKSRRTQFAPGAPVLDNPNMKKHIEELNKTMAQLEQYEQRALEAEHTLEDVKMELLKAEERAHEAEHGLKETKDLLKAATEGGVKKNDKVDDLQRSLKDVTNRLSASEENLLAITSEKNIKDQELLEFKLKLEERDEHEHHLNAENGNLKNEIAKQNEQLESIKTENAQLKENLKKLELEREEEKANAENALREKVPVPEENGYKEKCDDLERINNSLQGKIDELEQRLQDTDKVLTEFTTSQRDEGEIVELKEKLATSEKQVEEKILEVEELISKNNYLESLVTKLNRRESDVSSEQYKQENEKLKEKIAKLEADLEESSTKLALQFENTSSEKGGVERPISPELPKREQVEFPVNHIIGIKPPLVLRDSKPLSPDRKGGNTPDSTVPNLTPGNLSLELTPSEVPIPAVVASTEQSVVTADRSLESADKMNDSPNPIPKPPRGQPINDPDDDFVIVENPMDPTELSIASSLKNNKPNSLVTVEPVMELNSNLPSQQQPAAAAIDIDATSLPIASTEQDHVDSEEDEGQFQLIQEEIEDEKASLDNFSPRKNTGTDGDTTTTKTLTEDGNSFFNTNASVDQSWLNEELKRLDREADLIAEQVALNSPVKRKVSPTASSSSEENDTSLNSANKSDVVIDAQQPPSYNEISSEGVPKNVRSQSIKIDTSYFTKSPTSESFDQGQQEVSVIDDVDQPDPAIPKSMSFSSIPITPTLDTKAAQDKRQLASSRPDKRKPPTRGARGSLAGEADEFQIKQNSLPRNLNHNVLDQQLSGAKSVPNLSSNRSVGSGDHKQHEKHKHKFGFNLAKVFKKNKLGKKNSTGKLSNPSSPSVSNSQLPSTSSVGSSDRSSSPPHSPVPDTTARLPDAKTSSHGSPAVTFKVPEDELKKKFDTVDQQPTMASATTVAPADGDVVPLEDKTSALNQEKVNDAATEEAVVPFAEKLMAENGSTDNQSEVSSSVHSASLDTPFTIEASNSISTNASTTSPDDITLELSQPSSRNSSAMDVERKNEPTTLETTSEPDNNVNSGQFNERPIDIGHPNGHTDEEGIDHWTGRPPSSWDVRQVGLWLVEMDLSQYVNNFKSHQVDGPALLTADGNKLKEYGVSNSEHRAEIKKKTKEFRSKLGKDSFNKGKYKDTKKTKDKLQFWKGKYKVAH